MQVLESGNPGQRRVAFHLVRSIRDVRAVPSLIKTLSGEYDAPTKTAAIDALAELGDASAVPALRVLLRTQPIKGNPRWARGDDLRGPIIDALAKLGEAGVVPDLLRETLAGDWDARSAIVTMGDAAVPVLADALTEGDPQSQKVAAELIAEIKAESKSR